MIEPSGELGLLTQQDPQWQINHGAPRDPQLAVLYGTLKTFVPAHEEINNGAEQMQEKITNTQTSLSTR